MKKENFPLIYGSPKDKPIFTPKGFVEYTRRITKYKGKIPKYCIISFYKKVIDLAEKYSLNRIKLFYYPVYKFKHKGIDIGITYFGVGAPFAGSILEELIAAGFKHFIIIGSTGTLQPDIEIGDLIIPTKAIRDEGTSYHYANPTKYAKPIKSLNKFLELALKQKNLSYRKGVTWTVDAPYRETIRKAKKYQKEGVLCAEMEAAALFTIANYRKVNIGFLFYVSDSIANLKWNPQFHSKCVESAKETLLELAMDTFHLIENKKSRK